MASYRFRVKADWNPRGLWRDIVIGEERTLEDLHEAIVLSFGLEPDPTHLWFFGADQKYWDSRVKYKSPLELESKKGIMWDKLLDYFAGRKREKAYNAAETTITHLDLKIGDRLCYLYDYGDEWRFYIILKKKIPQEPPEKKPQVVKGKGEKIHQY